MSSPGAGAAGSVGGRARRGGAAAAAGAGAGFAVTCGPLLITVRSESPAATEIGAEGADSLTVMMFEQLLQRIFSIRPRTFSSAMEYLVRQRSQTNFIRRVRGSLESAWVLVTD